MYSSISQETQVAEALEESKKTVAGLKSEVSCNSSIITAFCEAGIRHPSEILLTVML